MISAASSDLFALLYDIGSQGMPPEGSPLAVKLSERMVGSFAAEPSFVQRTLIDTLEWLTPQPSGSITAIVSALTASAAVDVRMAAADALNLFARTQSDALLLARLRREDPSGDVREAAAFGVDR